MANRESKDQLTQDLYETEYISHKETLSKIMLTQPYPAAYFFSNQDFLKNDKPVYGDINLETSGGSKSFTFEVFPVGGFLQYINSFYVSDNGKLTISYKSGMTSQSKLVTTNSKSISGAYDSFSLKLGVNQTTEVDKSGSKEIDVTVTQDFMEGNYFVYQTAAVCAYKLGAKYNDQIFDIFAHNKEDYDMRIVKGDLYFFIAKHRNDCAITETDTCYRSITQKEFVDYLTDQFDAGSRETWDTVTAR